MKKVYVALSDYDTNALEILRNSNFEVTVRDQVDRPDEDELCLLVQEYDVLIIGAKEKMTEKVYSLSKKLEILGTLSIGVDHIHNKFFEDSKINVLNCPNSNVASTAEHTFALILSLSKKIIESHNATLELSGRSGIKGFSTDLFLKTIGVIGAGRIGSRVIRIANAFDMKILCYTRNPEKHDDLNKYGVEFKSLNEIAKHSDIISLHLPLTKNTQNLINSSFINKLKKSALIVNTARVTLVDNEYLSQKIKNGEIKGYALDVDIEDENIIDAFRELDNVILTPHTAGVSIDAMIRMDMELAKILTNI